MNLGNTETQLGDYAQAAELYASMGQVVPAVRLWSLDQALDSVLSDSDLGVASSVHTGS
jgi:hypothetical protein